MEVESDDNVTLDDRVLMVVMRYLSKSFVITQFYDLDISYCL